ncbi:MAG: hypothetical protein ACK5MR_08795, partial [Cumulibacter sp.]
QLAEKFYINKDKDITYTTLRINDNETLSLGGEIIEQSKEGVISIRVKLETQTGAARTYNVYNKETKTTTAIPADQAVAHLTAAGLVEQPREFNVLNIIPVV